MNNRSVLLLPLIFVTSLHETFLQASYREIRRENVSVHDNSQKKPVVPSAEKQSNFNKIKQKLEEVRSGSQSSQTQKTQSSSIQITTESPQQVETSQPKTIEDVENKIFQQIKQSDLSPQAFSAIAANTTSQIIENIQSVLKINLTPETKGEITKQYIQIFKNLQSTKNLNTDDIKQLTQSMVDTIQNLDTQNKVINAQNFWLTRLQNPELDPFINIFNPDPSINISNMVQNLAKRLNVNLEKNLEKNITNDITQKYKDITSSKLSPDEKAQSIQQLIKDCTNQIQDSAIVPKPAEDTFVENATQHPENSATYLQSFLSSMQKTYGLTAQALKNSSSASVQLVRNGLTNISNASSKALDAMLGQKDETLPTRLAQLAHTIRTAFANLQKVFTKSQTAQSSQAPTNKPRAVLYSDILKPEDTTDFSPAYPINSQPRIIDNQSIQPTEKNVVGSSQSENSRIRKSLSDYLSQNTFFSSAPSSTKNAKPKQTDNTVTFDENEGAARENNLYYR